MRMAYDEDAASCDDALWEMVCEFSDVTVQSKQMWFGSQESLSYG
jgi:hypothetical protein